MKLSELFSRTKRYDLSLSREYVSAWTYLQAIRELLQNAIDSESKFEFNFTGTTMSIHSRASALSPSTLLLGTSSKGDDESKIGQYGEGYKLAMLVLLREGFRIRIFNGNVMWVPSFSFNKDFGAETLVVLETPMKKSYEGLTFVIEGLDPDQIAEVQKSCLHFEEYDVVHDGQYGQILPEPSYGGKLYVNGLFVCETKMKFGYNVKPQYLKLERDRQTVDSFELAFLTRDMWLSTKLYGIIQELIFDQVEDVKYFEYGWREPKQELARSVATAFREKHPTAVAVSSQADLEHASKEGREAIIVPEEARKLMHGDEVYQAPLKAPMVRVLTPTDHLKAFLSANRKHMRRHAIVDFNNLIEQSKDWK